MFRAGHARFGTRTMSVSNNMTVPQVGTTGQPMASNEERGDIRDDARILPGVQTFIPNELPCENGRILQFSVLWMNVPRERHEGIDFSGFLNDLHLLQIDHEHPFPLTPKDIIYLYLNRISSDQNTYVSRSEFESSIYLIFQTLNEHLFRSENSSASVFAHSRLKFYERFREIFGRGDNRSVADYLLSKAVAIQASPLTDVPLAKLLAGTSVAGIGTMTGLLSVTADDPLLVFTSVAGGIIVVGTAMGVGRALNEGLYHKVMDMLYPEEKMKRLLEGSQKPSRARRPTSSDRNEGHDDNDDVT